MKRKIRTELVVYTQCPYCKKNHKIKEKIYNDDSAKSEVEGIK